MTAQVKFFPMKWNPPSDVMNKLEELQMEINHTRKQIELQEKNNRYMEMVRKQALASLLRSKIKLIKPSSK